MTRRAQRRRAPKPAHKRRTRPWAWVLLVAVLVGAAWWTIRGRHIVRDDAAVAPALPDSILRLPPRDATMIAMRLIDADRPYEALLHLRHAARFPGTDWTFYVNYATALHNSAMMGHARDGRVDPVTRSSYERIAAMREAIRYYDVAERMAATPADKALVCYRRANTLTVWGLPIDALESYSRAAGLDPKWRDVWGSYTDLVLHPTEVTVAER